MEDRIPIEEAIERLVEEYRMRLESDHGLVEREWLEHMDQEAQVCEQDDDFVLVTT